MNKEYKDERFYFNGSRWTPSGTTVIGMLDKPALVPWAAGCAVDYLEGVWDEVSITSEWMLSDDFITARTAYLRESKQAAGYGTFIHWMCEQVLTRGEIIKIPKKWTVPDKEPWELKVPISLTRKFMDGLWKWVEKHNVKVIAMEHEVTTDTYGGRLDLVCEMDSFWMTKAWCEKYGVEWYKGIDKQRVIVLIDFKTGKAPYYDTWKYQLAGYRQAWNEEVMEKVLSNAVNGYWSEEARMEAMKTKDKSL